MTAEIDMALNDSAEYPYDPLDYSDGPQHKQTRMLVHADPDKWSWTGPLGASRPHQPDGIELVRPQKAIEAEQHQYGICRQRSHR